NTHTHLGLANPKRVLDQADLATEHWFGGGAVEKMKRFVGQAVLDGAALCSVVPRATPLALRAVKRLWNISALELTPRTIREVNSAIGKNTEQAMLIGAVHGCRGLVRQLIGELKRELKSRRLPVVATGGYARFIAAKMPEITAVYPSLTLEGLRLVWQFNHV